VIVVSDSSPLIALAQIRRLDLLASMFERILIPTELHHEVISGRDVCQQEQAAGSK
jgi:predicted nucleic acid-binding protein